MHDGAVEWKVDVDTEVVAEIRDLAARRGTSPGAALAHLVATHSYITGWIDGGGRLILRRADGTEREVTWLGTRL